MVSSSLSKNIYADKINADKINANQIKANQIIGNSPSSSNIPSYLFSIDINEASYDSLSGILSFSKDSVIDIIQFSDRPLKYSKDITIEEFDELFSEEISDNFTEQKPNLVLNLMNSGQNSFELTKFEVKNGTINYTLKNIGTQTINIPSFNNQRVSLFVDNVDNNSYSNTYVFDVNIFTLYEFINNKITVYKFDTEYKSFTIDSDYSVTQDNQLIFNLKNIDIYQNKFFTNHNLKKLMIKTSSLQNFNIFILFNDTNTEYKYIWNTGSPIAKLKKVDSYIYTKNNNTISYNNNLGKIVNIDIQLSHIVELINL